MGCNKCKKRKCGCKDVGFTTPLTPPCDTNTADCPGKETCAEVFDAQCIVWNGDPIVDAGITTGMRMSEIIQRLVLFATNPSCIQPDAECQSPLNLKVISRSTNTVTVQWDDSGADSYEVEYKLASDSSWTVMTATTLNQQVVGLLTAGEEYHIRVNGICSSASPSTNCYSLTISAETN